MSEERTFREMIDITHKVIRAFEKVEQRPWTIEATMIELMKQAGDLSKHIMVAEQYYLSDRASDPVYATTPEKIGDELADIFYCLIRIAEHYNIDLEAVHLNARREELRYLGQKADF